MSIEHLAKSFLSPVVPVMEESDVITNLRAERDALAERLRVTPDMRAIVGQLRGIRWHLEHRSPNAALTQLRDLLRRLDRES